MKLVSKIVILSAGALSAVHISTAYIPQTSIKRSIFIKNAVAITLGTSLVTLTSPNVALADSGFTTTDSGMMYKVTTPGTGAIPNQGATVKAHYTGWLDDFDSTRKFDSSRDRGRPFTFKVGAGQVIRGWDEAFGTMKVGERRQIILPPNLAYGDRGAGGVIPGDATLYFDVELLGIV